MRSTILLAVVFLAGCSGNAPPSVPSNATSSAPETVTSVGGGDDNGKSKGGEEQQLRPR